MDTLRFVSIATNNPKGVIRRFFLSQLSREKELFIVIEHRIHSCQLFAEKKCPNQLTMERTYLIPRLLDPKQLQEYQKIARSCKCATISSKVCKDTWD